MIEVLLYVHRKGDQDVHLDFHTAPELWQADRDSVDIQLPVNHKGQRC